MDAQKFDIAVIGAGISGLAFSRFYLDIHPQTRLAILEEDDCIGGVWSTSRGYEEFWNQSGQRMTGFSDVPLRLPDEAPVYHDMFEAKFVTKYLEDYVDSHIYDGISLRGRVIFGYRVEKVEKIKDAWIINPGRLPSEPGRKTIASKLVVATGVTSIPNMPSLPTQEKFAGPIIHHKQFGQFSRSAMHDVNCRHIAVLGAGKSSVDMVYECIKKNKIVNWIIRLKGEGPALFTLPAGTGRYRNSVERNSTRLNASLSPSSFMPDFWLLKFFHRSNYGKNYVRQRIQNTDEICRKTAAYQTREAALPGFRELQPTTSAFWCTGPLGFVQHEDFWSTLAQHAHVFRREVVAMDQHSITLDDGTEIPADIVLCGTGWKPTYPFFSSGQAHALGLAHPSENDTAEERQSWTDLLKAADERVVTEFPLLEYPPPHRKSDSGTSTSQLYNCIAPLNDSSIAFLGHAHLANSFRTAEAQAIWTTAYFDGSLSLPPEEQAKKGVAYMNAFSRRRYPTRGARGDYLFFETVWYTDRLMEEVGLKSHRRRGWWWNEWLEPCLASDYKDMVAEYRQKYSILK